MLGSEAETALHEAGITVNKNAIPFDTNPPLKPSGIRIGTPALTTRGMKEAEMKTIGKWIAEALVERENSPALSRIRGQVLELAEQFPLYGWFARAAGSGGALILRSEHVPGWSSRLDRPLSLSSRPERSGVERSAIQRFGNASIVPVVAASLLLLALSPAWLRAHGDAISALAVVAFFSKLCHQRPDRVLYLFGAPTAVCLRCLGTYAGAALGGLLFVSRNTALRGLSAALLLNVIDVAAESIGPSRQFATATVTNWRDTGTCLGSDAFCEAVFSEESPGLKDSRAGIHSEGLKASASTRRMSC